MSLTIVIQAESEGKSLSTNFKGRSKHTFAFFLSHCGDVSKVHIIIELQDLEPKII